MDNIQKDPLHDISAAICHIVFVHLELDNLNTHSGPEMTLQNINSNKGEHIMQHRILNPFVWLLRFSLLFLTILSLPGFAETADRHHQKQTVIVKLADFDPLTWEDPIPAGHNWQPACMAVMMADHMLGEEIGSGYYKNDVILFLNLQAVALADTATAADLSGFVCGQHSLQESWDALLHKGVDIVVCPGCAVIGGITPETLRAGARIAGGAPEVTEIFLRADKVIDF